MSAIGTREYDWSARAIGRQMSRRMERGQGVGDGPCIRIPCPGLATFVDTLWDRYVAQCRIGPDGRHVGQVGVGEVGRQVPFTRPGVRGSQDPCRVGLLHQTCQVVLAPLVMRLCGGRPRPGRPLDEPERRSMDTALAL